MKNLLVLVCMCSTGIFLSGCVSSPKPSLDTTSNSSSGVQQVTAVSKTESETETPKTGNAITEKWVNTPAEVKKVSIKDNTTYLSLDILEQNPDFQPGITDFFVNPDSKVVEVSISDDTKSYICGAGADDDFNTADVSISTQTTIENMQQRISNNNGKLSYYFDIEDNMIKNIYQQCLP